MKKVLVAVGALVAVVAVAAVVVMAKGVEFTIVKTEADLQSKLDEKIPKQKDMQVAVVHIRKATILLDGASHRLGVVLDLEVQPKIDLPRPELPRGPGPGPGDGPKAPEGNPKARVTLMGKIVYEKETGTVWFKDPEVTDIQAGDLPQQLLEPVKKAASMAVAEGMKDPLQKLEEGDTARLLLQEIRVEG